MQRVQSLRLLYSVPDKLVAQNVSLLLYHRGSRGITSSNVVLAYGTDWVFEIRKELITTITSLFSG